MTIPAKIDRLYTDGACSNNPGPGGWGVLICYSDGSACELGDAESETTNNRMEMQAAIAALKFLVDSGQSQPVTLYTDSEYVKKGITQWIRGWKKKNWKTASGKPVLNRDLWEILDTVNSPQVRWEYVRGHSGDPGNERCDQIARTFAQGQIPTLQQRNELAFIEQTIDSFSSKTVQSTSISSNLSISDSAMTDLTIPMNDSALDTFSRTSKVGQLRDLIDSLRIADEIADKGYLISSSELADLINVNASAVTSRGDHWVWRNWVVSRVRREGNQILWQLERVD
ncbi:MAG: ribonuclease HI [Cyanobacteriota bacterium]|nr:ribonuclease HI [Cyanobacteriota bacterium]